MLQSYFQHHTLLHLIAPEEYQTHFPFFFFLCVKTLGSFGVMFGTVGSVLMWYITDLRRLWCFPAFPRYTSVQKQKINWLQRTREKRPDHMHKQELCLPWSTDRLTTLSAYYHCASHGRQLSPLVTVSGVAIWESPADPLKPGGSLDSASLAGSMPRPARYSEDPLLISGKVSESRATECEPRI